MSVAKQRLFSFFLPPSLFLPFGTRACVCVCAGRGE